MAQPAAVPATAPAAAAVAVAPSVPGTTPSAALPRVPGERYSIFLDYTICSDMAQVLWRSFNSPGWGRRFHLHCTGHQHYGAIDGPRLYGLVWDV